MTGDITALFQTHISGLKRSGANGELVGLCCFHDDKKASFSANLDTGLWICHAGCGQGDAATFAERIGVDPKLYYKGGNGSLHPGNVASNPEKETPLPETELSRTDKRKAMGFHLYLLEHHRELQEAGKIPRCWTLEAIKITFTGYDPDNQAITFIHTNQGGKAVNIRWHKAANGDPPLKPGAVQNLCDAVQLRTRRRTALTDLVSVVCYRMIPTILKSVGLETLLDTWG